MEGMSAWIMILFPQGSFSALSDSLVMSVTMLLMSFPSDDQSMRNVIPQIMIAHTIY